MALDFERCCVTKMRFRRVCIWEQSKTQQEKNSSLGFFVRFTGPVSSSGIYGALLLSQTVMKQRKRKHYLQVFPFIHVKLRKILKKPISQKLIGWPNIIQLQKQNACGKIVIKIYGVQFLQHQNSHFSIWAKSTLQNFFLILLSSSMGNTKDF